MKMISKRIIAVAMAMLLGISVISVGFSSEVKASESSDPLIYIALGDSVTESVGVEPSYVSLINEAIGADYYINGGVSGCKSDNLLDGLRTNVDVRSCMTQTDIVTVYIGFNDMAYYIISSMAEPLGCEPTMEAIGNKMYQLQMEVENATGFDKYLAYMKLYNIATKMHDNLYTDSKIQAIVSEYKSNLNEIVKEIKALSPDTDIYLANLYQPYTGTDPVMLGSYKVYDMDEVLELWIAAYNDVIYEVASDYGYPVADVHSRLTLPSQLVGDPTTGNYDPHPNAEGQRVIAEAFLEKIVID